MNLKIAKKIIAISHIFIFILSLSNPVFADLIQSNEDGVAYDLFEDDAFIDEKIDCTVENGTVTLESRPFYSIQYDYDKTPDNIEAWEHDDPFFVPGGDIAKILSTITSPNLFAKYEFENIATIGKGKDYYQTESIAIVSINYVYHPLHLFKIKIDEKVDQLVKFEVGWRTHLFDTEAEYENTNLEEIRMYLWSYGDLLPRWNFIDKINYTKDEIESADGYIYTEESANKFINNEGIVHILIVGKPIANIDPIAPAILTTDYVVLEIPVEEGYKTNGNIISKEFKPDTNKFYGWDKIIWESSIPTENTYVKIQVLNANKEVIPNEELEGNEDGFLSSPVDISSLDTSFSSIRLKALFHTKIYKNTPLLFSWGVLWHSTGGFFDSFKSDYKISESLGINIKDGDVTISEFYSEWPIFGKNPANTRSYTAPGYTYNITETYWRTDINRNIGGWFRSPIMSDGKIYIAGNDSKIYSFNLSRDGNWESYESWDESNANYEIETSFAVDDEYLIAATSRLNSRQNKIYALNTSDLKDVKWSYPKTDPDKTICFSAAPTIANEKVYVTSWSGQNANQKSVNYLYSRFDSFFNYRLGVNNKLFILDLKSGIPIIAPIRLPAASLSTPAIDNGFIYVGCENFGGPSLFAYDESTGKTVWNASVGTIGRASPVVAKGKDGKIVIVVSREQPIFSNIGTDKVIALNAENGEMLWNYTIGNESVGLRKGWLQTYEFNHIKAVEPPAATPAVFDGIVYVMSSNGVVYALDVDTGTQIWNFKSFQGIISEYHSVSPVVVDDIVYIISQEAKLYTLDAKTGEKVTDEHKIEYEGWVITSYAYSSPIVTDGMVIVSFLDWRWREENVYFGHLICLGDFKSNLKGKLYSVPIRIGRGKWWDTLKANHIVNTTFNKITYSILDEDGNTLISSLSGIENDISESRLIKTNVIQLCAELSIFSESDPSPILADWGLTWKDETASPIFFETSFEPDLSGWIKNNTPICSIKVRDSFPGLNKDEAYYKLIYLNGGDSGWIKAECDGAMGSRTDQTITADLTKLSSEPDDLKKIEFRIEDLSGNTANFKLTSDFKIDQEKPISLIENIIGPMHNSPVNIIVNADDIEDQWGNKSGIDTIGIYYRMIGEEVWNLYDQAKNIFNWQFSPGFSGEFEISTIATDLAGNAEDFPENPDATFIYDAIKPEIPEFVDKYEFNWIPEFNILFEDDYKLQTVEYRTDFSANWTKINDEDINAKNYTAKWDLSDEWAHLEDNVTYNIFIRLTDAAGNQNVTLARQTLKFLIDTIPPGVDITLDLSDFEEGGKDSYTISAIIPDDDQIANVTLHYQYSSDESDWSSWMQYDEGLTTGPYEWMFKAKDGSGYYRFSVRVWDAAGNFNTSPIKMVNFTEMSYLLLVLLITFIIILFLVSITILKKMKIIKG